MNNYVTVLIDIFTCYLSLYCVFKKMVYFCCYKFKSVILYLYLCLKLLRVKWNIILQNRRILPADEINPEYRGLKSVPL